MKPLTSNEKHLLRLIAAGMVKTSGGWAIVSKTVWPLMVDLPPDLVELRDCNGIGGFARLTEAGQTVRKYI